MISSVRVFFPQNPENGCYCKSIKLKSCFMLHLFAFVYFPGCLLLIIILHSEKIKFKNYDFVYQAIFLHNIAEEITLFSPGDCPIFWGWKLPFTSQTSSCLSSFYLWVNVRDFVSRGWQGRREVRLRLRSVRNGNYIHWNAWNGAKWTTILISTPMPLSISISISIARAASITTQILTTSKTNINWQKGANIGLSMQGGRKHTCASLATAAEADTSKMEKMVAGPTNGSHLSGAPRSTCAISSPPSGSLHAWALYTAAEITWGEECRFVDGAWRNSRTCYWKTEPAFSAQLIFGQHLHAGWSRLLNPSSTVTSHKCGKIQAANRIWGE